MKTALIVVTVTVLGLGAILVSASKALISPPRHPHRHPYTGYRLAPRA
jgi:hypothetical protein